MATVSGGSKPTFTVDQVLHAVEMNQLNQEWIVDSVPAGSAGKNGDVVFVTNKGGVWAKVSGSWVQASLTSADMQTLQDQIDIIQSSGYDDTQLRSDFAAADASTLADSKTYTDNAVSGISVDTSTLATKAELTAEEDARKATDALLQTQIDAIDVYDPTDLESRVSTNEGEISTLQAEQVTQNTAIQGNTDAINALVIPDVSDFTTKDYVDAADATKFDKGATTYSDAKAMEDDITTNKNAINDNADVIETKFDKGATTYNDAKEIEDAIAKEIVDREAGDSENLSAINDNTTSINALSNRLDALENTSLSSQWEIVTRSTESPNSGEIVLSGADWLSTTLIAISHTDKNNTTHDFSNIKVGDTIQIGVGPEAKAAGSSAAYEVTGLDSAAGKFDVKHLASTGTPTQGFIAVVAIYPAFDPSNYATQAELQAVDTKVDQKVDIVSNGSDNAKTNGVMALTQAQYDALGTKDPLTIYLISDYVDPLPDLLDGKFDLGAGTTNLNDATVMEAAIDTNAEAIAVLDGQVVAIEGSLNALIVNLGGNVDVDGNITLPNIDLSDLATKDELGKKFDKGDTGPTTLTTAELMEAAIDQNSSDIELLVTGLGGDINNIEVDALPDQTGNDGKFLTTDGSDASWSDVDSLPDQKDQDGKFLKSNGVDALWAELEIVPHAHNYDGSIHDGDGEFVPHTHTQYVAKLENTNTPSMECSGIMALTQTEYDAIAGADALDPLAIYLITDYKEPDFLTEVNTANVKLTNPVDVVTRELLETQEQANQYFATELETKLTKGLTWGELAGRG